VSGTSDARGTNDAPATSDARGTGRDVSGTSDASRPVDSGQAAGTKRTSGASGASRPVDGGQAAGTKRTSGSRPLRAGRRKRRPEDPFRAWARRLERTRPGLVRDVLDGLRTVYGAPTWVRRLDPTSELILTILSQNSADVNAERAFEGLRARFPGSGPPVGGEHEESPPGWGGKGIARAPAPDWAAVETAPLDELVDAIRPGGLAVQKAPRIQAALRAIRERSGGYSLEFLGDLDAREARDWLTSIDGIGPKTASVVLMFSFGMPLMPVDRHVERVGKRIGLIPARATADEAHEYFLALLEPDQVYEAHVNLIRHGRLVCTARSPAHERCPVAARCRFVDPRAP
jgi:endonuclease-3